MKKALSRILSACMVLSMLLAMAVVPTAAAETSEDSLSQQIAAATAESPAVIFLEQDVTLTKTISIPVGTSVEIRSGSGSVLTRGSALTGALFDVPANSTLKLIGTSEAPLTLDGASVTASTAMISSSGSVVLENVLMENAVSSGTGGAVYLSAGSLNAVGSRFENNSASSGGAIDTLTKKKVSLTLTDCSFTSNTAKTNGGAINLLDTNTMTATGVQFIGNKTTATAKNKGGAAAYVANTSASFENCTFTQNSVIGDTASIGGAVCFYALGASKSTCSVKNSTFTENTAPNGGALGLSDSGKVRASNGTVNWSGCAFTGNSASGKGGAIAIAYDCRDILACNVSIDQCTYSGNSAATDNDLYTAAKANIKVDGILLDASAPEVDPNYTAYTHVSKVPNVTIDGKELPDLAGMGIVGDYAYSIKLKTAAKPSGDTTNYHLGEPATLWRTDLKTGETVLLTEASTGKTLIDYVGHANGVAGATVNGETYLYVATLLVGNAEENTPAVVKLHVSGNTFEKVGAFNVLEGSNLKSRSGIDVLSVDAEKTTLLLKTGGNFFTAQLPHTQASGDLQSVSQFSINMSAVSLTNGTVLDASDWTWQDCGYHDGRLYVPVCKGLSSVVAVFSVLDEQGNLKTGTLNPDKNCSIQLGDAEHRMVEVESCAVYGGKLYFNANRTLQDGSNDCDGVCYTDLPPTVSQEKPSDNPAQDALVRQIQAAAGSSVTIELPQDITVTSTISIPAGTTVELKAGSGAVLKRGSEFTDALFHVAADSTLKLTGTSEAPLTLDGACITASTAMISSSGSVVLERALLKNAVSSGTGGAVYLSAGSLTSVDSRFENNSAKSGGAIDTAKKNISLIISGGSFTGNTAQTNGGAINLLDSNSLTASDVRFTSNKATASAANKGGGAVYAANASASFENCFFDGNSVDGKDSSNGGAICFYALGASANTCSVKNCTFTGNTAPNGGAIGISDNGKARSASASVALERCSFSENAAADKGGAITIPFSTKALSCTVTLTDCTYADNLAAEAMDLYTVPEETDVIITVTPKEEPKEEPKADPPAEQPKQDYKPAESPAPVTADAFLPVFWLLAAGAGLIFLFLLRKEDRVK